MLINTLIEAQRGVSLGREEKQSFLLCRVEKRNGNSKIKDEI